jgi:hypothetical protein
MTSNGIFDHSTGIAAIIAALTGLVTAVGQILNNRAIIKNRAIGERSAVASEKSAATAEKSVAVSERNERAIAGVQDTLHNGIGEKIATKIVESTVPVLKEHADAAALKVEAAAEAAATKLKTATWDGVERRVGPVDRRGP